MKDSKSEKNTQKPIDFIFSTLKILQNKTPMPDGFLKKEIYKYPFEILNNLNIEEKQETLNKIKKEYNKYFSEEYEIAKQYWKSMNVISSFLCDEEKKNLLNNEEIMTLLDNYKSEEEMLQIESEIKNNMNSENDDAQFWRNAYELLNYLKHKKLMEDLYNNFINNQRINYKLKIEEKEKNSKENNNIDNKNKKEQEINDNDRYKLLYKDLETIRYNRFMNEDSDENDEVINDDEKTEDDLSPQKYESDSEGELNKIAINQMDYFAKLNASRKKILQNKINEYNENKINEDIMNKNRKKINKLKDKHTTHTKNNKNSLNLEEQEDIDIEEDNKQKANKFLDFIMNQKQKQKEELLEKDDSSSSEKEESDKEALNFLQKIKGHKNKNSYLDQIKDLPLAKYDNDKNKKEEKDEEMEMTEFQKTIQNFDKYLDKNDISGVYTNLEIIENTFRDLEKNSDNELVFNDIVEIKKEYEWSKDYKPIKPRYANKKILGFDWNRHNQAHYDNVNLPPKTVNGYRFNIFYPNLVDKTKTPKFYLQRSETPDMCIIRFESGAPYEDVAFKIINREWNTRQKGDFLNVFDKGVLKLYFKFKRFRYKR